MALIKGPKSHLESLRRLTTGLVLILASLFLSHRAESQNQPHTVETGDYIVDLPSKQWRAITVSGPVSHSDFRFGADESIVRLRIRREIVKDESVSTTDLAERQRRLDRSSRRGYVTGTVESFQGQLSGTKYSYEYVTGGKPVSRVIYYLRATKRTIYRIEFSGSTKALLDLTDQTQSIARSFRVKS